MSNMLVKAFDRSKLTQKKISVRHPKTGKIYQKTVYIRGGEKKSEIDRIYDKFKSSNMFDENTKVSHIKNYLTGYFGRDDKKKNIDKIAKIMHDKWQKDKKKPEHKFTLGEASRIYEKSKTDKSGALKEAQEYVKLYTDAKKEDPKGKRFGKPLQYYIDQYKDVISEINKDGPR